MNADLLIFLIKGRKHFVETTRNWNLFIGGYALQEYLKGLLFAWGIQHHYLPIPEFRPYKDVKQRIDMVYATHEGRIAHAYELDKAISRRSIDKLHSLPDTVEKVIISFGKGRKFKYKYYLTDDIQWINMTSKASGGEW